EEDALALHHRLGGARPDVAEPQDGRSVGDHRHQVAPRGVKVDLVGILRDGATGRRDAGRVRLREVELRGDRFGPDDLDLAGPPLGVVAERVRILRHRRSSYNRRREKRYAGGAMTRTAQLSVELERAALRAVRRSYDDINGTYFRWALRAPAFELVDSRSRLGRWVGDLRLIELSRHLLLEHGWGVLVEVLKHEMVHQ